MKKRNQVKIGFKIRERKWREKTNVISLSLFFPRFLSLPFSFPFYSLLSPTLHRRRCPCRRSSSPRRFLLATASTHFSYHLVWTFEKTLEFLSHGLHRTRFALTQTLSLSLSFFLSLSLRLIRA